MKPLSLEEIYQAVNGRWLRAGRPVLVESVTTDTRSCSPGGLYLALRGERFDGHDFLSAAAQAGCVAAMVEARSEPRPEIAGLFPGGVIGVKDTLSSLGKLASYHRGLCHADVVGVTGSNGKTTVKWMIHHVLSKRLKGTCSPKSFNNDIGVPLTLLGASMGDDYVICEIGSNHPGEIAHLSRMARPEVAVITSIGPSHLEHFGTVERIIAEKASILESLSSDGLAVIWGGDERLNRLVATYRRRTVHFGELDTAELRLTKYEPWKNGQRFQVNDHLWVDLPLPGKHNAINALAAIAVAQRFGFTAEEAAEALADFAGVAMRMERIECGQVTVINDAYNANPASVEAAARTLADLPGTRRKVLILGDMRELGDDSDALHEQTGRRIAEFGLDLLIGVGLLGRYIAEGAASAGMASVGFDLPELAGKELPDLLQPGDLILIKGSRAMRMERLLESIREAFEPKSHT